MRVYDQHEGAAGTRISVWQEHDLEGAIAVEQHAPEAPLPRHMDLWLRRCKYPVRAKWLAPRRTVLGKRAQSRAPRGPTTTFPIPHILSDKGSAVRLVTRADRTFLQRRHVCGAFCDWRPNTHLQVKDMRPAAPLQAR